MSRNPKISALVAVIVGAPLAIISKMASEIIIALFAVIILLSKNSLNPPEIQRFVSDIGNDIILGFACVLINILVLPFAIGYIIAKISKDNAMLCAIIVCIISATVGLYFGFTANAIIKSLLKNVFSCSMIMVGAFVYKELEYKENP